MAFTQQTDHSRPLLYGLHTTNRALQATTVQPSHNKQSTPGHYCTAFTQQTEHSRPLLCSLHTTNRALQATTVQPSHNKQSTPGHYCTAFTQQTEHSRPLLYSLHTTNRALQAKVTVTRKALVEQLASASDLYTCTQVNVACSAV